MNKRKKIKKPEKIKCIKLKKSKKGTNRELRLRVVVIAR